MISKCKYFTNILKTPKLVHCLNIYINSKIYEEVYYIMLLLHCFITYFLCGILMFSPLLPPPFYFSYLPRFGLCLYKSMWLCVLLNRTMYKTIRCQGCRNYLEWYLLDVLSFRGGGLDKGREFWWEAAELQTMQMKVFNVDAQIAFKILIILHQFSHKVNLINCPWLYVNQLLKLFGQEMKFSAEKPAT